MTGRRRIMPIVLAVSLAVNLAVVAAMAGAAWRHKEGGKGGPRADRGAAIYMKALPREARTSIREQTRDPLSTARVDPMQMLAVLRADPFDAQAAADLLAAQRKAGFARIEAVNTAWLKEVSQMSVAERGAYADRLEELSERRSTKWKERKKNRD
ncbi:periplasmic heavy metal sensor [uncultured Sulfitobacter sp.]|nr:periplasmic heavy metal sensor [uncultured Sulfitobacter sp.]